MRLCLILPTSIVLQHLNKSVSSLQSTYPNHDSLPLNHETDCFQPQQFSEICMFTSFIRMTSHTHMIMFMSVPSHFTSSLQAVCCMTVEQQCNNKSFYGPLSGTTQVSQYQKKHSPTHHPDHHPIFISFFQLPRSTASSSFKLRAWQSFCTISLYVLFGLPLGLEPFTSYYIHFFAQSVSSFRNKCHTIATCFAVESTLYHPFLVFLSTPYLELYLLS